MQKEFYSIHDLAAKLSSDAIDILPAVHALTGIILTLLSTDLHLGQTILPVFCSLCK